MPTNHTFDLNELKVRQGEPADAPTIVDFQLKMAWETESLKLDELTVTKGVRRIFNEPQRGKYLIAEHRADTVGSMLVLNEWSDWRNGDVLWIHSLYILPDYRAQGIFRRMYEQLKAEVEQDEGLKGLRLYVDRTNVKAQKAYEKMGMTAEHYQMYEWLK
jgi:GNAT superfamily N-acetyltransferase